MPKNAPMKLSASLLALLPLLWGTTASADTPPAETDTHTAYCVGLFGEGLKGIEACASNTSAPAETRKECTTDAAATKARLQHGGGYLGPLAKDPSVKAALDQQASRGAADAQKLLNCSDDASCKPVTDCFKLIDSLPQPAPSH